MVAGTRILAGGTAAKWPARAQAERPVPDKPSGDIPSNQTPSNQRPCTFPHLGKDIQNWCTGAAHIPDTPSWWAPQPARQLMGTGSSGQSAVPVSPWHTSAGQGNSASGIVQSHTRLPACLSVCPPSACLGPLGGIKVGSAKGGRYGLGPVKQLEAPRVTVEAKHPGAGGGLCR